MKELFGYVNMLQQKKKNTVKNIVENEKKEKKE